MPIRDVETKNDFYQILSPHQNDQGVWIHQNAWFNLGSFDHKKKLEYKIHSHKNGVYAFIIEGKAKIEGQSLDKRDGYGIWNMDAISIEVEKNSKILLMEGPMQI